MRFIARNHKGEKLYNEKENIAEKIDQILNIIEELNLPISVLNAEYIGILQPLKKDQKKNLIKDANE